MGILEECEEHFGSKNLYDVLGITKDSSDAELKKAYKRASLLCHPDKVPSAEKEAATRKFQILNKVHCILSDQELRAVYDDTGCIDEESSGLEDKDWANYWRLIFPKLTVNDIDNYMKKYKGSPEEIEDLKKCYIQYEGDMDKICQSFMGYDVDEEENYHSILTELIENKEIPDFPAFTKEKKAKKDKRIKKFKKEAVEAKKSLEKMEGSLVDAILKRQDNSQARFDDMIKNLEAKYSKSSGSKKRKK